VPGVPDVPSADELAALPADELAARLAEAYRLIGELTAWAEHLTAQAEELSAQVVRLQAQVEELERQGRRDSSTSSRPPSSDARHLPKLRAALEAGARLNCEGVWFAQAVPLA
jgi:hypothetical protein